MVLLNIFAERWSVVVEYNVTIGFLSHNGGLWFYSLNRVI